MEKQTETAESRAFTPHIISLTNPHSPWYEYCPDNEDDLRDMIKAISTRQTKANTPIRVYSINEVIKRNGLNAPRLTTDSPVDDFVEAYMELYRHNFIIIGYTRSAKIGPQIFSVKEEDRIKVTRLH